MEPKDMRISEIAIAGGDGMLNLHMRDKSDPAIRATIVYNRENGELFDAYARDGVRRPLDESEALGLLAIAVCQLAQHDSVRRP